MMRLGLLLACRQPDGAGLCSGCSVVSSDPAHGGAAVQQGLALLLGERLPCVHLGGELGDLATGSGEAGGVHGLVLCVVLRWLQYIANINKANKIPTVLYAHFVCLPNLSQSLGRFAATLLLTAGRL